MVDEPLAQVSTGTPEFLHRDGLGSVTAISSSSGSVVGRTSYAPFGGVEEDMGVGSRFGFTGREAEPGDLMYYRARFYDPDAGRFTTQDLVEGLLENPQSLNRYAYALGNPVNYTDPSGESSWSVTVIAGKAILISFLFLLIGAICALQGEAPACIATIGTILAGTPLWVSAVIAGVLFLITIIKVLEMYRNGDFDRAWTFWILFHILLANFAILTLEAAMAATSIPTPWKNVATGFVLIGAILFFAKIINDVLDKLRDGTYPSHCPHCHGGN
jgi:RHS repeat-associated protein